MKVSSGPDGDLHPDHQADGPGDGVRRVHRRHADRGGRPPRWPTRWRRPGSATRTSTTRTATRRLVDRGGRSGPPHPVGNRRGSRSTTTPTSRRRGRSRAATSPDAGQPAVHRHPARARSRTCGALLHDRRISRRATCRRGRRRARASRSGGASSRRCPSATVFTVSDGSLGAAGELQAALGKHGYDAVVGIGGGRTLDVAKYAATRAALPMVAVATNLAHDGIALPGRLPGARDGKGSFGVAHADRGGRRPGLRPVAPPRGWSGPASATWSATCRPSTTGSWPTRERGEPVDGLAVAVRADGRRGGAAPHRTPSSRDDFLIVARRGAGAVRAWRWRSPAPARPCSGACHEIIHAIDVLFPGAPTTASWPGVGRPVRHLPARGRWPASTRSPPACAGTSCRWRRRTSG